MTSHTPGGGSTRVVLRGLGAGTPGLRGSGRRAFYLAEPGSGADAQQPSLLRRCGHWARLTAGVVPLRDAPLGGLRWFRQAR